MITLHTIVDAAGGRLLAGDPSRAIDPSLITTDSRSISAGGLFIALKGAAFDGHAFAAEAIRKGACGAVVDRAVDLPAGAAVIRVRDTTKALQDIAAWHRKAFTIPVVAVTGSNGKTTVKEMLAALLAPRYAVLKNEGTKNNHIGVPQTVLHLTAAHTAAILELGTNHPGEIRLLSRIARPAVAVITTIGPSHLEFFGSLRGVWEAKKEIFEYLDRRGMIVANGDDPFLARVKSRTRKVVRFGLGPENDYRATEVAVGRGSISFLVNGAERFEMRVLGTHNVYNALAAIAVASSFGVDPAAMRGALAGYRPASMRLDWQEMPQGFSVINDAYNSNPLSMECALGALRDYPARARWVVCGDMLELGKKEAAFHRSVGRAIAKSGVDGLMTFGMLSRATCEAAIAAGLPRDRSRHCASHDEIVALVRHMVKEGDVVLIKGSRAMKMETIVERLKAK